MELKDTVEAEFIGLGRWTEGIRKRKIQRCFKSRDASVGMALPLLRKGTLGDKKKAIAEGEDDDDFGPNLKGIKQDSDYSPLEQSSCTVNVQNLITDWGFWKRGDVSEGHPPGPCLQAGLHLQNIWQMGTSPLLSLRQERRFPWLLQELSSVWQGQWSAGFPP